MRTRTWIVLLLALGSGLIAGYAALQLVSNRQDQPIVVEQTSSFQVVVAAHDMPVGSIIGEEDVRMVGWPENVVPEGYARQIPDVIGRGITQPVMANEPILASKLADRGVGGLPSLIPEGMRAQTLRVDDVISVGGFVLAGTRVDVLLTIQPPGTTEFITRTVLQNLEVAAAGPTIIRDPEGKPVQVTAVTLYVTPEQSEELALAAKQGTIQLTLRNQLDVREARTPGARLSRLLSGGAAPAGSRSTTRSAPPPATTNPDNTLEVIRGSQRSIVRFGRGGGNQ